ncbi:MAG TPA: hypothetical protein VNQ79_15770 [Blastocatellia bacterium]|nr:hypothetical protein [Blastocatellia bacterium]
MRRLTVTVSAVIFMFLLSVGAVFAGDRELKEHVTFREKVMVGNTLVKPGDYLIRYNTETGEMKVMKGDDVVAQARAMLKVNNEKVPHDVLYFNTSNGTYQLTGLKLGGQREELVLSDTVAAADCFSCALTAPAFDYFESVMVYPDEY